MFSGRLPASLVPNRLSLAVERFRATGRPFIDLTESNPTRAGLAYPDDLLAPLADPRGLTYTPQPLGLPRARAAVSGDYLRRGLAVPPEHIALTVSSSESYSLLFRILCDAGDEVLIPRPSYPLFDHLTRLDAVTAKSYDLEYHGAWAIDVDGLIRQMTGRTRAVLIVSPNNPTGSFIGARELDRIAAACAERSVAIIVDEVFADYELEPGASSSAGQPLLRDDVLVFGLGGLSKTVGLPQVKLGWIAVAGPEGQVREGLARLELACDTYLSVSTPIQGAAEELLRRGEAVRIQIQKRISGNQAALAARLGRSEACDMLRVQGGWYAVLQVPTLSSEEDLVLNLLEAGGVLVHPGYFFDFPRESFLVVSLLPSPSVLAEGIARVLRHFDCSAPRDRE